VDFATVNLARKLQNGDYIVSCIKLYLLYLIKLQVL